MRGNLIVVKALIGINRSIPAGAGEPSARPSGSRPPWVYPRGCGGTLCHSQRWGCCCGLSPRVRGNRSCTWAVVSTTRSIPAGAGEPRPALDIYAPQRVYPRGCGGTHPMYGPHGLGSGLSPRVRGNRRLPVGVAQVGGSIPAGAGEPPQGRRKVLGSRVYPRGCGGTSVVALPSMPASGLSPRVRGNQNVAAMELNDNRSIPAGAGEPASAPDPSSFGAVYPRGCGGTLSKETLKPSLSGLSPRVRGNLGMAPLFCVRFRSIPAGAGEPPNE